MIDLCTETNKLQVCSGPTPTTQGRAIFAPRQGLRFLPAHGLVEYVYLLKLLIG